jgi:predicted amidohydrolase YtcJ
MPESETTMTDLIVHNARITTLDPANPAPEAFAVADGRFVAIGSLADVLAKKTATTRVIDAGKRRVIPGLIDSHMHVIRGGLNYNMELRWDGVSSLVDALALLKRQVDITPAPQWVRVVGGFTMHQFAEKRLPTLEELNRIAPHTPVFVLHLYDRALLNAAALRAVGYTKDTPNPPGGEIQRDSRGEPTGLLVAKPNAGILYATLAKGPKLPPEYQLSSTRHFMREMNRLGVTSVIDAGGGFQNYPDDYSIVQKLAKDGELTLRIAYNLFTQKAGAELEDFQGWAKMVRPGDGDDSFRHNGAGEMLVFSAADFEDFREPRPELPVGMEAQLEAVIRTLVANRWPWRLHATYDESISRALDVFERVNRDMPFDGLHWFFDHAETISDRNIDRIAALEGGIAVQHRMMFQGEDFVQRYGAEAAERSPPIARMLAAGIPVGAGTDATRVASHNPWVSLSWLVTGKTLGGLRIYPKDNRLDREAALRMWTENNTWFSTEENKKGQIKVGQLADFAVLSADFFAVPEDDIAGLEAVLTVLGGKVVHGAGPFSGMAPPIPPAMPDWSPARWFGERGNAGGALGRDGVTMPAPSRSNHHHGTQSSDASALWGPGGCGCWAF